MQDVVQVRRRQFRACPITTASRAQQFAEVFMVFANIHAPDRHRLRAATQDTVGIEELAAVMQLDLTHAQGSRDAVAVMRALMPPVDPRLLMRGVSQARFSPPGQGNLTLTLATLPAPLT